MNIDIPEIYGWILTTGLKIAAIIFGAWLIRKFGMIFVESFIRKAIKPDHFARPEDEKLREDTLIAIIKAGFGVVMVLIAGLLVLDELGLNIGPLLASAGIVGVALGFGGQWLIKDLIAGLFIIMENQYRVGDVVTLHTSVDPVSGVVEDITLRITSLRDMDGKLHQVPNGAIVVATNLSMGFAGINLDIRVAYDTDIDKVTAIINRIGKDIATDKDWKDKILETPEFLRIDSFNDSSIIIKIVGKTAPLAQWDVAGELRKRIKLTFDKEGIEIPYPQVTVRDHKSAAASELNRRSAASSSVPKRVN